MRARAAPRRAGTRLGLTPGEVAFLRRYSRPVDLSCFDARGWMTAEEDLWYIPEYLVDVRHDRVLTPAQERHSARSTGARMRPVR